MQQKIITNLWFDTEAEEAAGFYTSIFESSRIVHVAHYTEAGPRRRGRSWSWSSSSTARAVIGT